MFKLLLVEDEEKIRKSIKNVIDWKALEVEICGEASNGYEALKLASTETPDIVLTDIKMPIMDGLQLIEKLNKEFPRIKFIIMSGYDDFDYIQRAIKLGVFDYLLKPSGAKEIQNVVEKAKRHLLEEREREINLQNLINQSKENIFLMKEKYLNKLIISKGRQTEISGEKLELYNINFRKPFVTVVLIRIIDLHCINDSSDIELIKLSVKNIIEKKLLRNYNCEVFENLDDIVIIINTRNLVEKGNLLTIFKDIKETFERQFNHGICFGIGRSYENLRNIRLSYDEAVNDMEEKLLLSNDFIELYQEILEEDMFTNIYILEKEILSCIKSGSKEMLVTKFNQYFNILNEACISKDVVIKSVLGLIFSLYQLCIERNINIDEIFGINCPILNEMQKPMSMNRRKEILIDISKKIYISIVSQKSIGKILKNAIEFIECNYYKDLSRKIVAQEVYITPSYLSFLFKKEMNTSFIDYLHSIRIERACELLKDIKYKTYDVAVRVGYSDEKYFFKVFKKYKGITPMQYRNNFLNT
ncbi:putative response regulatory protein [Clostridium puniceum]|uniref:Stage 0 sporulation protein A homolog n=1 Tax=Clostridium puniceum TaxID=29367 RepID=A0A1S8TF41_9CLOT|nr:response regulator [Clostridium puniceum]OOM76271.1 putative response regulatory protein [Clostridium puniceum]